MIVMDHSAILYIYMYTCICMYLGGICLQITKSNFSFNLLHICAGNWRHFACRFGFYAMIVEQTQKYSSILLLINAPIASPTTPDRREDDELANLTQFGYHEDKSWRCYSCWRHRNCRPPYDDHDLGSLMKEGKRAGGESPTFHCILFLFLIFVSLRCMLYVKSSKFFSSLMLLWMRYFISKFIDFGIDIHLDELKYSKIGNNVSHNLLSISLLLLKAKITITEAISSDPTQ